eukprot:gnl/TRDRNA2_/TRDRNA2_169293_c0_seq1.p1 gnl/TRDRNA2_/TRDRNA2_169293_c0~~gnl/TRDRNA2_/TRDRNA2_169293_c0_seq1.p1  ORF type:complete len:173 (-),score=21.02 gnl/TRDRNA2_/TRDRNA2_169293_c0_seq1:253-771(-)
MTMTTTTTLSSSTTATTRLIPDQDVVEVSFEIDLDGDHILDQAEMTNVMHYCLSVAIGVSPEQIIRIFVVTSKIAPESTGSRMRTVGFVTYDVAVPNGTDPRATILFFAKNEKLLTQYSIEQKALKDALENDYHLKTGAIKMILQDPPHMETMASVRAKAQDLPPYMMHAAI